MAKSPTSDWLSPLVRYGLALLLVALTTALRWWVDPLVGPRHAFLGANLTVVLIAYRLGTGPAVVALLAIGIAFFRLFIVPHVDLSTLPLGPLVVALFSLSTGGIFIWLFEQLQRSRRDLESQAESAISAEARLRERDTYLREFLDHTSAVVYLKDLDGRLLLANNRGAALGEPVDETGGSSSGLSSPPESLEILSVSDSRVIATGQSQTFEETAETPDGRHAYVTVKFPILDDQRKIIAVGGVSTDVTELHNARADLERKEHVLRNLIEIQEQEKQLLCGEFHDGLIQYAVGAKMMLESLPREVLPAACGEMIDTVIGCLARGIDDGRRVIRGIRPAELDDLGLDAAIQTLIGDLEGAGIDVEATIGPMPATPPAFQVTVYRIVQEAFSNVRRHSGSPRAKFEMRRDGNIVVIRLEDFGNGGSSESQNHQGFGITGMQERARLVGGECRVEFRPGRGTMVTARLPLPASDGDGDGQKPPAERRLGPSGEAISAVSAAPL